MVREATPTRKQERQATLKEYPQTYLKSSLWNIGALRSAISVGMQQVKWTLFPNAAH